MQADPQESGDYVFPVPMTDLQKKVTSAIVSSNFSEILSYFDGSEQSRIKNTDKLSKMLSDLSLLATHPYLLLPHLQPSLSGKRAPLAIESMSGKFQSLVMLAKRFTNPEHHVAIVCEAGHTTDLVELVLADRGMNVTRYSSQPAAKLYKKEVLKRRGATFHLVPSELKDLRQAVYAAFDVLILLDNKFDVNGAYGQGLRAQLRDPVRRRPLASVVRLVVLNSAQHAGLYPEIAFEEKIAFAVVRKKQVGTLPAPVKQFYAKDFSQLQPFISNCDGPFPLKAVYPIKPVGHRDVERALYLDDEDQYQVDFANRRGAGASRRMGNRNAETDEDDEDGSDDSKSAFGPMGVVVADPGTLSTSGSNGTDRDEKFVNGRTKRRRVELEDDAIKLVNELSASNPLSVALIVQLNDLLAETREDAEEIESHRRLASNREYEIERLREQMQTLAAKVLDLEKKNAGAERRSEKLRIRNEKLEQDLRDTEGWWAMIADDLKTADGEPDRLLRLTTRIDQLKSESLNLQQDLENAKSRFSSLQSVASASSEYADQITKEQRAVSAENAELKSRLLDEPAAKEQALEQQLKAKAIEVNALKAELENLRESIKIQLSQERTSTRGGDRRYGGRGGRGASRQATPHVSVSS